MVEDCREIQNQLAGYIDHEMAPAKASAVSRHLEVCPGCAEEANAQEHVKELVRAHAKHVAAPPYLRAQISHNLDRHSSSWGFWAQLRHLFEWQPIPAFATVMVMVLASGTITYYGVRLALNRDYSEAQMVDGRVEGEVVCVDCVMQQLAHIAGTHDSTHRLGLRCINGYIWGLVPSEKSRELIEKVAASHHRQVRVYGQIFPRIRYVQVKDFSLI